MTAILIRQTLHINGLLSATWYESSFVSLLPSGKGAEGGGGRLVCPNAGCHEAANLLPLAEEDVAAATGDGGDFPARIAACVSFGVCPPRAGGWTPFRP
jgi:hypothetical protein